MSDEIVFRDFTRAQLDAEYNNRTRVPEHEQLYAGWAQLSAAMTKQYPSKLDVSYDDESGEKLDIFVPKGEGPFPIMVFFHGGYWMSRSKNDVRFAGKGLLDAGAIFISVDYTLIPEVEMDELLRQCRAAVTWTIVNAERFKGDPERVFVGGNSAGGHITGMMTAHNWLKERLPMNALKGGCALSGLFELEPMRHCYLNDTLELTMMDAFSFSPRLLRTPRDRPLVVAVGADESSEFIRQSKEFCDTWSREDADVRYMEVPGANHFTILNHFADPNTPLFQSVKDVMGLA